GRSIADLQAHLQSLQECRKVSPRSGIGDEALEAAAVHLSTLTVFVRNDPPGEKRGQFTQEDRHPILCRRELEAANLGKGCSDLGKLDRVVIHEDEGVKTEVETLR